MAGRAPLRPENPTQVRECIDWALAAARPLRISGHGSKSALGRPCDAGAVDVRLDRLTGVTAYEPSELVLTAAAGTSLAEVSGLLASRRQRLAFEPPDHTALLAGPAPDSGLASGSAGAARPAGTLGGLVGANLAGPRRIVAGAVRDHLLGFHAISGRGDPFKSGGRVVKNVTGYDLPKLMAGSWGSLAVLTELTLKVMPAPDTEQTVLWAGLSAPAAVRLLTRATGLPHEGSAFAHLPMGWEDWPGPLTAIRIEGAAPSIAGRARDFQKDLEDLAGPDRACLAAAESARFWAAVRDGLPLATAPGLVWRLSVAPASGPAVVAAIQDSDAGVGPHFFDWAGGLVWLSLPVPGADPVAALANGWDGGAGPIRRAVAAAHGGGHAMLFRAPAAMRAAIPVFHPQAAGLAALSARVRDAFDPQHILNPGRLYAGPPEPDRLSRTLCKG